MNIEVSSVTPHLIEDLAKTGIYSITQKSTGRKYIGSTSENFYKRWRRHLSELKKGNHHSQFLQRTWDKCGSNDFVFEIIEFHDALSVSGNLSLLNLEQSYLDKLTPEFNISPSAHSRKGMKVSNETRARIKEARKYQVMKPVTEETKKKISESNKGKHEASIETRRKMAEAKKGLPLRAINTYVLTSPDGVDITVKNLKDFCRENNLNYQNLFHVIRGDRKSSQGWKIVKINPQE
jgi:group I intron endonuclease